MATAPALTPEELAKAKKYMKVDVDTDDEVVTDCVLGAREYLAQAGVSLPALGSSRRRLYDLTCHALALGDYDERTTEIIGTPVTENRQLRRKIKQLEWTEPEGET